MHRCHLDQRTVEEPYRPETEEIPHITESVPDVPLDSAPPCWWNPRLTLWLTQSYLPKYPNRQPQLRCTLLVHVKPLNDTSLFGELVDLDYGHWTGTVNLYLNVTFHLRKEECSVVVVVVKFSSVCVLFSLVQYCICAVLIDVFI